METQHVLSEGQLLLESGDAKGCVNMVTMAMEFDKPTSMHYLTRAVGLMTLERYPEALADCGEALRLDPENKRLYLIRGVVCRKMKKLGDAIANLNQALEIHPDFNSALLERALCLLEVGRVAEAEVDLRKALAYSETAVRAYCDARGVVLNHFNGMDVFLEGSGDFPHLALSTTQCNRMGEAIL